MAEEKPFDPKQAIEAFNNHGYPFQSAVAQTVWEMNRKEETEWGLEATEVPVSTGGYDTRIDLVLSSFHVWHLMLVECVGQPYEMDIKPTFEVLPHCVKYQRGDTSVSD